MLKNHPLILALRILIPVLLFSGTLWGKNEKTISNYSSSLSCTMKTTATPDGVYCGETTGTIDIKITGGTAPFKIEWDNQDNSIWEEVSTNLRNYTINDVPKGMYIVKVMDAKGCREMHTIMMDVNASDLTYTIETSDPCRTRGSLTIRVAGSAPPYWVILEGPTSGAVVANDNAFRIDNILPGSYKVIVDKDGCGHEQNVNLVTTPVQLSVSATSVDYNECDNFGDVDLTIQGGTAEYLVSWHGPTTGSTRTDGSRPIQNLEPGDYTFTVSDANRCTASTTVSVTSLGTDLACVLTQTPVVCDNKGQIGVAISGGKPGYTVEYIGPVSGSVSASSTGSNSGTASILDLPTGSYTISVNDSRGCIASESITVGGEFIDIACIVSAEPVRCKDNGRIDLSMSRGYAPFTVAYSGPISGSLTATTTGDKSATARIRNTPNGNYTLTVTDSRGCSTVEQIKVGGSLSIMDVKLSSVNIKCNTLGKIDIEISDGLPSYKIDYSGQISGSIVATNTSANSGFGSITGLTSGRYTITVTDAEGCSVTRSINISGKLTDIAVDINVTPVQCDNMGQVGVTINGGIADYSVDYTGPKSGSVTATRTSSRSGTATILDLPNGNYTITVIDRIGCSKSASINVGGSLTDLACIVTQKPRICDNLGTIAVVISGGQPDYSVEYSGPSSGSISANTTGTRTGTAGISGLSPGTYTITVIDSRGCSASESITVGDLGSNLSCVAKVQPQICENNSGVDVGITGGTAPYTISYAGPTSGTKVTNGTSMFIQLPLGNYTITVTDANGCIATENAVVGRGINDLHCRLVQRHAICHKPGGIEVIISGGKPGFTVKWSGGGTEGSGFSSGFSYKFDVPSPDFYNITVIDANGCVVMEATEVRQLENNLAFTMYANPGVQEGNGWIEFYWQNGRSPYTIDLTGPRNEVVIVNGPYVISSLPSGQYSVNITDANGCVKQQYINVPIYNPIPPPNPGGMSIISDTDNPITSEETELEFDSNKEQDQAQSPFGLTIGSLENDKFEVYQNYPNPFSSSTTIGFNLPKDMNVTIEIYDHVGRTINRMEQSFSKGKNLYQLKGSGLGKGVYYYSIQAGTYSKVMRMIHME